MTAVRHAWRFVTDLWTYAVRTGRWWVPVVTVVLAVAALLVAFVKVAVPTAVYLFF